MIPSGRRSPTRGVSSIPATNRNEAPLSIVSTKLPDEEKFYSPMKDHQVTWIRFHHSEFRSVKDYA